MSALPQRAFNLEPQESLCGFPGCTAKAFHEGDHTFAEFAHPGPRRQPVFTCSECGSRFVVYGEFNAIELRTCGEQACILSLSRRTMTALPIFCSCPQRRWPHEVSVHRKLRSEGNRHRWPWSLALAARLEPSTETVGGPDA